MDPAPHDDQFPDARPDRLLPRSTEHPDDLPTYMFDITAHENHRLAAVLAATPDWDPGAALAAETEARRMLYSGLDDEQQAIYRMLREAACSMRDPQADMGRRAWLACPRCSDQTGCAACAAGHSCGTHWRFLLAVEGRRVFVQCPECWYRWWHDTGFGAGDRPAGLDELPDFPQPGGAAA